MAERGDLVVPCALERRTYRAEKLLECRQRELQTCLVFFFFSSRRRHTRFDCDWSSDGVLFRSQLLPPGSGVNNSGSRTMSVTSWRCELRSLYSGSHAAAPQTTPGSRNLRPRKEVKSLPVSCFGCAQATCPSNPRAPRNRRQARSQTLTALCRVLPPRAGQLSPHFSVRTRRHREAACSKVTPQEHDGERFRPAPSPLAVRRFRHRRFGSGGA